MLSRLHSKGLIQRVCVRARARVCGGKEGLKITYFLELSIMQWIHKAELDVLSPGLVNFGTRRRRVSASRLGRIAPGEDPPVLSWQEAGSTVDAYQLHIVCACAGV